MSLVTTHVLDTARGAPAAGMPVALQRVDDPAIAEIASATTDDDGRVGALGPDTLPVGRYRLVFDVAAYRADGDEPGFFPEVVIVFTVADGTQHHHVPLLLSPFGYTTYRGS